MSCYDEVTMQKTTGWSWVLGSALWHYFDTAQGFKSLCKKVEVPDPVAPVLYDRLPIIGKVAGQIQHAKTCTACRRKLDESNTKEVQRPESADTTSERA